MKNLTKFILTVAAGIFNPFGLAVCRYEPHCTAYAREAVHVHSLPHALALIVARLWRCAPWGGTGFDPVPDATSYTKDKVQHG